MTRRRILRPAAQAAVDAAADWYDTERPALASEFLDEVERLLVRIETRPAQFPVIERTVRRGLTRRFPYAVYFVDAPDRVAAAARGSSRASRSRPD